MTLVTPAEIAQYRSQLSGYPLALVALDAIEDCEGDLEDAAISLAIHVGQEPNTTENWLDGLAKRYRVVICQQEFREDLANEILGSVVVHLMEQKLCPEILITPVVIYVVKTDVNDFCRPLEYQLP